LCQNFATLQAQGHPKRKEVELARPDHGEGWSYYLQTAQELQRCTAGTPKPKPKCTLENPALRLCAEK